MQMTVYFFSTQMRTLQTKSASPKVGSQKHQNRSLGTWRWSFHMLSLLNKPLSCPVSATAERTGTPRRRSGDIFLCWDNVLTPSSHSDCPIIIRHNKIHIGIRNCLNRCKLFPHFISKGHAALKVRTEKYNCSSMKRKQILFCYGYVLYLSTCGKWCVVV